MTARRPKVPRAVRPSPPAGERTGGEPPNGHTASSAVPGHPTAGSRVRKAAPVQPVTRLEPQAPESRQPERTAQRREGQVPRSDRVPQSENAARRHEGPTPRNDRVPQSEKPAQRREGQGPRSEGPAPQRERSVSSSEARAAERTQLAGAIRRSPSGSTKRPNRVIEPAEDAKPIPAKSFSGRLLALAVVLVAVTVLLAPSLNTYLQQQAELNALRQDIARQEQVQADHQTELARWNDPAYIKQQARDRIFLVMPGETRYLVKGGQGIEDDSLAGSDAKTEDLPWVDSLWSTVTRAATD